MLRLKHLPSARGDGLEASLDAAAEREHRTAAAALTIQAIHRGHDGRLEMGLMRRMTFRAKQLTSLGEELKQLQARAERGGGAGGAERDVYTHVRERRPPFKISLFDCRRSCRFEAYTSPVCRDRMRAFCACKGLRVPAAKGELKLRWAKLQTNVNVAATMNSAERARLNEIRAEVVGVRDVVACRTQKERLHTYTCPRSIALYRHRVCRNPKARSAGGRAERTVRVASGRRASLREESISVVSRDDDGRTPVRPVDPVAPSSLHHLALSSCAPPPPAPRRRSSWSTRAPSRPSTTRTRPSGRSARRSTWTRTRSARCASAR